MAEASSKLIHIPAPTGGWNAQDSIADMRDTDALDMINVFPDNVSCTVRGGRAVLNARVDNAGGGKNIWNLVTAAGANKTIVRTANKLWNVTTAASPVDLGVTITGGNSFGCVFRNKLFLVNGTSVPYDWDGTTLTATAWTGPTLTTLIQVAAYRNRLYFTQVNTGTIYYGTVDGIAGALTAFDVSSLLQLGGSVSFCASTTRQSTTISSELFVIVSTMGEVLVYEGSFPGDASWNLIGRFFVGAPCNRRSFFWAGNELYLITNRGIVSVNTLLQGNLKGGQYVMLTDRIARAWRQMGALSYTLDDVFGFYYPRLNSIFIQVSYYQGAPADGNFGDGYCFFVYNLNSNAWTRFTYSNNQFAGCCLVGERLVGFVGGGASALYYLDYGTDDDGAVIQWLIRHAFTSASDPYHRKLLKQAQPLFTSGTATGRLTYINADTDFAQTFNSYTSGRAFVPDGNVATLTKAWAGMNEFGLFHSLRFGGVVKGGLEYFGTNVTYIPGGIM